jgi:hypothetical protein
MLDSLPMWQLYHLGGLYSVIHPDFIERIDFVPAGFDAGYGHVTGGVVDVKLRETPLTAWHAAFDVNLLHAGLIAGGPYSPNGDVQLAVRRSYIDAILGAAVGASDSFAMTAAPRYYDYQLKWQHRLGARHRFLVFVNGADDEMVLVSKRANMDDPSFVGQMGMRSRYHGALARWSFEASPAVRNALSLQASFTGYSFDVFRAMSFQVEQLPLMLRDDLDVRLHRTLKLHAGLEVIAEQLHFKVRAPEPPASGAVDAPVSLAETITTDERGREYAVGPFLSLEWQPVPRLTLVPSLRVEAWRGYRSFTYADPRLAARLKLSDTITLRFAGGLYQRPPDGQAWSTNFGNPHIGPEAAVHLIGGAEWAPTARLSVGGNVCHKGMFHLAEPLTDATLRYDNRGRGRASGADALVRVRPGGRFFGWIAYTYVRAERYDFATGTYRPSNYDQRHLLNVLGSLRLPRRYTVGARFRLTSGYPFTPVVGAHFDADGDRFAPIANPARNAGRLPPVHALDVRIDREWVFASWRGALYLELQNVYNHRAAEGVAYSYDYAHRGWVAGLPILPVIGARGEL